MMLNIVFLNPNKCMRVGVQNRQRELESCNLLSHFSLRKTHDISSRAATLARTYPKLSREARTTLLHPHVFPLFLGVKDAYIEYDGEPDIRQLAGEAAAIPETRRSLNMVFTDYFAVDIPAFRKKMADSGHLISDAAELTSEEVSYFAYGDPRNAPWRYKLKDMLEGSVSSDRKKIAIHGFLMGYPLDDIQYCMTSELSGFPASTRVIANFFGNLMLSDHNADSAKLLTGWEIAMKYGYRLLSQYSDFWDNLDPGLENCTNWVPAASTSLVFSPPSHKGVWN